jgi:hypothetical protein
MWIFTNTGFLSVVQKPDDKTTLTVRARAKGHIESVFPDAKVQASPGNDYAYRAKIDRATVAAVISQQIMDLSYSNFKNSIKDDPYHNACSGTWGVMNRYQQERARELSWPRVKAKPNAGSLF